MEQINEQKLGRKAEVDEQRVIDAGLKLLEQNKTVSGWKLRNIISSGNPRRLQAVWEQYQSEHGETVTIQETSSDSILPPDVEDSLKILLGGLNADIESLVVQSNNAAVRAADKRVKSEYEASKRAKENAEHELAEAEIALNHSDSKIEELTARVAELEKSFREATGDLKSSKTTVASLEKQLSIIIKERDSFETLAGEKAEEITQYKIDLSFKSNEVTTLHTEVSKLTNKLNNASSSLLESNQREAKIEGKLESAIATAEIAETAHKKALEDAIKATNEDNNKMDKKIDDMRKHYEAEKAKLSEELGRMKEKLEAARLKESK